MLISVHYFFLLTSFGFILLSLSLFFFFLSSLRWTLSHCLETSSLPLILKMAFLVSWLKCLQVPVSSALKVQPVKDFELLPHTDGCEIWQMTRGKMDRILVVAPSVYCDLVHWTPEDVGRMSVCLAVFFCTVPDLSSCLEGIIGFLLDTPLVSSLLQARRLQKTLLVFFFLP